MEAPIPSPQPEEASLPLLEETELAAQETAELPQGASGPQRIALCLSGGGFRAALFHLGALRRLNELGILSRVGAISSVSGGSIIAAHLAQSIQPWSVPGERIDPEVWETEVAAPFRAFTRHNLRTGPLLSSYLIPWNVLKPEAAVEALAARYEAITQLRLPDLPERPRFIFCATDIVFGVNWIFTRDKVGDYQAGYLRSVPDWPVARAVAASSCFPPVFNPLPLHLDPQDLVRGNARNERDYAVLVRALRLTDGGVYDNFGLEPVWKNHDTVLISDGGATFTFDPSTTWFRRLLRYTAIVDSQARGIRKRWLIASFSEGKRQGTLWGIGNVRKDQAEHPAYGYTADLVRQRIARVRTDLDAFSPSEIAVLENHGYSVADAALQGYGSSLLTVPAPPMKMPDDALMNPERAKQALRWSHRRVPVLGRW